MRRVGRGLAVALLAVGVAGAVRQLLESRRVRQGALAPVRATTRVVPSRQGVVARRVGEWVPTVPASRSGRAVAAAWAGPVTAVGFLLAALGGVRPTWNEQYRCFVATGVRGPVAWVLGASGMTATATGQVVMSPAESVSDALLSHEAGHVRQFERLGPLAVLLYAWWSLRHGYRQHPMERGARLAARRHEHDGLSRPLS